jgi:seryl-tRNA synthetase
MFMTIDTEQHVDPRGLKKAELLERTIKAERENKKLTKQVQRLEDEQKECLAVHSKRITELKREIDEYEDDVTRVRKDAQRIMDNASRMQQQMQEANNVVYAITNALQPIIAPEIQEAEERAAQAEQTLAKFREGLAALKVV